MISLLESERARALVEREVARAVAPYRGVLDGAQLLEMSAFVRDALLTHPEVARDVAQLAPPLVAESGELDTRDVEPGARASRRAAGGGREGSGGDGG